MVSFYWVYGPSFGYGPVNFANFDFHHDIKTVDRQLEDVLNATSTNLGEFRERGGKLLMYHGWARSPHPAAEQHQLLQRAGWKPRP